MWLGMSPANDAGEASRGVSWVKRLGFRPLHYALILLIHEHFIRSGSAAGSDDWRTLSYPWADALRRSILQYHEFPWWNPWSLSGQPLFADPQTAVFMPETLLTAIFGTVVGLKIAIVLYFVVGYEGTRFLCRELFGRSAFVDGVSLIPALVAPLALHFNAGHLVFVAFYFFPWLLGLAITWEQSTARSLAFGFVIGCLSLSYIHYTIIIAGTLIGLLVAFRLLFGKRSPGTWVRAALVVTTALGMSFGRLCLMVGIVAKFPRGETVHYPIAYSFVGVLGTLVQPFQDRTIDVRVAGLHWWELGSYVGLCVLVLAYEGFRRDVRSFRPLYAAAVVCLVLAWNNRDRWFPSYWLHFMPPWSYMLVITRWRLFGCYFLLVGAVHGLVGLHDRGRQGLATILAIFVIADLGYAIAHGYHGTFSTEAPPFVDAADPPQTVLDSDADTWVTERANQVSMGAESTLLGYGSHPPARTHLGGPNYAGEFHGNSPVTVVSWTPNRIVLRGTAGDDVTLNINPSNYWLMNGHQLFPTYRPFEPNEPFSVIAPPSGTMELLPRPPHWQAYFLMQAGFAIIAVALWVSLRRTGRGRSPGAGSELHARCASGTVSA
jgi:hypothetical protein